MSAINIFSPTWDPYDSYGRIANELHTYLTQIGIDVNQFGDGAPQKQIRIRLGGLLLGYPTNHHEFGALAQLGPRIAITMFESTELPDGWADGLNDCDAVIVPSQFLVGVMRDCGVEVPIHVIPLGVSESFIGGTERPMSKPLTFIAIGDRGIRKGSTKALFAFNQAFGDDMRYKLIIKSRQFPIHVRNPNIEIIADDYSDDEMAALYRKCHCMIFASAGEGFGLPPREFAATGGLVLATDWGGTADDIEQWGIPLQYTMTDAWRDRSDWYGNLGQWADVDIAALADKLRWVAYHYDSFADMQAAAARFVARSYRWDAFGEKVMQVWRHVAEKAYASER